MGGALLGGLAGTAGTNYTSRSMVSTKYVARASREVDGPRRRPTLMAVVLATVTALFMSMFAPAVAHAATVYEITGEWEDGTPGTVARGDVVTGIWRVNVNDDAEAPANEPVENVSFTVTLENGGFRGLPELCLTDADLEPVSAISEDGLTLTCNLGTVEQGTAVVVQTPVAVDGLTGEQLNASGTIAGQTDDLDPLNIQNTFGMDFHLGGNTNGRVWETDLSGVNLDISWSLRVATGSDPGPHSVTIPLTMTTSTGAPVAVGEHYVDGAGVGCSPFNYGTAPGHPWSGIPSYPADQQTAPFESCTLTQTGAGQFSLTITGIDYDALQYPTADSTGQPLPTDWDYVASGLLWLDIATNTNGSINVTATEPTYTSTTGLESQGLDSNNETSKVYTLPGSWSASWDRNWTQSGGTAWDDTYRVSEGTEVRAYTTNSYYLMGNNDPDAMSGNCVVLDTPHVDFKDAVGWATGANQPGRFFTPTAMEYYVGGNALVDPASAQYDPDLFDCGIEDGGWTSTVPDDPSTVKAVRMTYPISAYDTNNVQNIQLYVRMDVDGTEIGDDVWMFGSVKVAGGSWFGQGQGGELTATPDAQYPSTNGRRDILRIIYATPTISKVSDRQIVRPGEPATFTLTYSANGTGTLPDAVDDYEIVDTLPVGMTYVAGSATPEPAVTTDGEGRQVLTWALDGVPTNQPNALTYQAVAGGSVSPGQTLTNTATSSLAGQTSRPASAQVTTSSSGYTQLGKSTDQWFMNNPDGSGDSTGSWTVTLRSVDPLPSAFTDTIDILPYNGDERGTTFSGTYSVTSVDVPAGATVYYTTADRATLSDDPADDSNGDVNAPSDIWSTTAVANPTAIRVIGGELLPGEAFAFDVNIATEGAEPGDVYVNRAQARAEHTELVMRTSEPLTMGSMYSVSLKKYVQDSEGEWRDAQDASDYPVFKVGDEVTYRLAVTNTGQAVLNNVTVTDDRFDEGSFTVEELAPEEVQLHEYTVTIDGSFETSFVNTACVAADQPEDAEEPVQVNCDPAGIEVVNYDTVKTSDPSGADVNPGDVVTYTVTVTQEGSFPAEATFSDNLVDVLDDADLVSGSLESSTGEVEVTGTALYWSGTVGVGEVATVTYQVVVKSYDEIAADGNWRLDNVVFSPGCEGECNPPENLIGNFTYEKTADPESGTAVAPGQSIDYTITVTQQGLAGVTGASLVDDLSDVLDDATLDEASIEASAGEATLDGSTLTWTGDLAVDDVVTITYTVTVGAVGEGSDQLVNPVTSDDERGVCITPGGCRTEHPVGAFTFSKTADPASGTTVAEGEDIVYTVTITHQGAAALSDVSVVDDLTDVVDDATYNEDVTASSGEVTYDDSKLTWNGDLEVGQVVTFTYSVEVTAGGSDELVNPVTSEDERGVCDVAVGCETNHPIGRFTYSKTADPASGTAVVEGEDIVYTVTISHEGKGALTGASVVDDLTDVVDDAIYNEDVEASSGEVGYADSKLTWNGDLEVGQVVTFTYSVSVTGGGSDELVNPVTSTDERGTCDAEIGCETQHPLASFTYSKTADPATGTAVEEGEEITYTVTITHQGAAALSDVSVVDDLADVIDDATYNEDVTASSGEVTYDDSKLTWNGDLEVGQVVTFTYTVQVTGGGSDELVNPVTSDDERGACDVLVGCVTQHEVEPVVGGGNVVDPPAPGNPANPVRPGVPMLPNTGGSSVLALLLGLGLATTGGLILVRRRRSNI